MSVMCRLSRSHARSLESIAKSKSARSSGLDRSYRRTRIAHISRSLSGVFWPAIWPLFQGIRRDLRLAAMAHSRFEGVQACYVAGTAGIDRGCVKRKNKWLVATTSRVLAMDRIRAGASYLDANKGSYALIACINGTIPMICIVRFKL